MWPRRRRTRVQSLLPILPPGLSHLAPYSPFNDGSVRRYGKSPRPTSHGCSRFWLCRQLMSFPRYATLVACIAVCGRARSIVASSLSTNSHHFSPLSPQCKAAIAPSCLISVVVSAPRCTLKGRTCIFPFCRYTKPFLFCVCVCVCVCVDVAHCIDAVGTDV